MSNDFRTESAIVQKNQTNSNISKLKNGHNTQDNLIKIVVTPPLDQTAAKMKNRQFKKSYTIDVQGWQSKKSDSKINSLNDINRSV